LGSASVEVTVRDPDGKYLARRTTLRLPLDPDSQHVNAPGSLFTPVDVALYPSPVASTAPGWAIVRASVAVSGSLAPLSGALIRVLRGSDGTRLALGLSDGRGEALVAIPGIPVTTWDAGAGAVLASEIDATVQAVADPVAPAVPDPDDLEARQGSLPSSSSTVKLASGRVVVATLDVALP
jgi:hypothetical protein